MTVYIIEGFLYDVSDNFKGKNGDSIKIIMQAETIFSAMEAIHNKYKDSPYFRVKITRAKKDSGQILDIQIG